MHHPIFVVGDRVYIHQHGHPALLNATGTVTSAHLSAGGFYDVLPDTTPFVLVVHASDIAHIIATAKMA
jgi:hypothetical protein